MYNTLDHSQTQSFQGFQLISSTNCETRVSSGKKYCLQNLINMDINQAKLILEEGQLIIHEVHENTDDSSISDGQIFRFSFDDENININTPYNEKDIDPGIEITLFIKDSSKKPDTQELEPSTEQYGEQDDTVINQAASTTEQELTEMSSTTTKTTTKKPPTTTKPPKPTPTRTIDIVIVTTETTQSTVEEHISQYTSEAITETTTKPTPTPTLEPTKEPPPISVYNN